MDKYIIGEMDFLNLVLVVRYRSKVSVDYIVLKSVLENVIFIIVF